MYIVIVINNNPTGHVHLSNAQVFYNLLTYKGLQSYNIFLCCDVVIKRIIPRKEVLTPKSDM